MDQIVLYCSDRREFRRRIQKLRMESEEAFEMNKSEIYDEVLQAGLAVVEERYSDDDEGGDE